VEELQEVLKQATKGTRPWSDSTTQSDAAVAVSPGQGASDKKSTSKGVAKAQGAGRGKSWRGGTGGTSHQDPKTDLL